MEVSENEVKHRKIVSIKRATLADNIKIYRVIEEAFKETESLRLPPLDEDAAIAWVLNVTQTGVVYVAEYGGRVIGSIGMYAAHVPWAKRDDSCYLETAWLYIHPKYRTTGTADMLVRKVIEFAKAANLSVMFGALLSHNEDVIQRLDNIKEIKSVGEVFIYQASPE